MVKADEALKWTGEKVECKVFGCEFHDGQSKCTRDHIKVVSCVSRDVSGHTRSEAVCTSMASSPADDRRDNLVKSIRSFRASVLRLDEHAVMFGPQAGAPEPIPAFQARLKMIRFALHCANEQSMLLVQELTEAKA